MVKKLLNRILHGKTFNKSSIYIGVFGLFSYAIVVYFTRHFFTGDTTMTQASWWNWIMMHGFHGIATLNSQSIATGPGVYTTIWYVIIWFFVKIGLYPHFSVVLCIKFIAVICSGISSVAMFFIAKHFWPKAKYIPIATSVLTLFLPAFLFDEFKTNLPDSMYLMFSLYSFLMFVKGRKGLAWLLLGVGASFKLMAIYMIPVYVFFYLKDFCEQGWHKGWNFNEKLAPFLMIVGVIVCSVPNVLAGGSWMDAIIKPILSRGSSFEGGAPGTLWSIWPNQSDTLGVTITSCVMLAMLLLTIFLFIFKFIKKSDQYKIGLAILPSLSAALCYFVLPAQHESYFAIASVFALIGLIIGWSKATLTIFLGWNLLIALSFIWVSFAWWNSTLMAASPFQQSIDIKVLLVATFIGLILYTINIIVKSSNFKLGNNLVNN